MSAGPRIFTGLAAAGLAQAVARADRLLFHAALYSNFARDRAMAGALEIALARPSFGGLDVLSFDVDAACPFQEEFLAVLRQDMAETDLLAQFALSRHFLAGLAARHQGRVRLFETESLPCAPILLVGDVIFAGHYAHASVPAPEGLWLAVPADVAGLVRLAEAGAAPHAADAQGRAAFRFVAECVAARAAARRVA